MEIARADAQINRINQFTPFGNLIFSGPNRNTATLSLTPELQANTDLRLESDTNLLRAALERQGLLDPNPIDLSQFGDIQTGLDLSNVNFAGPQFGQRPSLQAPELQQFQGSINNPFQIQGSVDTSLDTSGLPAIPQDIAQFRGDVESAVFDRGRALLDPVFSDQERAMRQRLANQGIPESGEAFDRDFERFGRTRNQAFTDLANRAVVTGGQEASRALGDLLAARGQGFGEEVTGANLNLAGGQFANQAAGQGFGQGLAEAQFGLGQTGFNNQVGLLGLGANQGIRGQLTDEALAAAQAGNQASAQNLALQQQLLNNQNAARAQALAEAQGIRGNQFNELASLLGLQQVQAPGISSFFAPGQADVTNAFALNQQAQQNAFNTQNQRAMGGLGGLFGLGAALIGGPFGGALGDRLFVQGGSGG